MNKILILSLLIPFTLVCSCQKQDSTAEQQLAQRKTELDAREKALDEREKLVAKPRVTPVPRIAPAAPQRTIPPELQGLIPDPSQVRAEREQHLQERLAERRSMMEEIRKTRAARVPARSQTTAPATEAASPSQSPTPE